MVLALSAGSQIQSPLAAVSRKLEKFRRVGASKCDWSFASCFPAAVTPNLHEVVDIGILTPRQALDIAKRDAVVFSGRFLVSAASTHFSAAVAAILLVALLTGFVLVPH